MDNRQQRWIRIAEVLLGVLLGVFLTLTVVRYRETHRILSAQYIEWRKLNLILSEIERNYVDTLDQAGMTDAAIAGALAQLDPHSVYLPPVKRQQADEELAGNFEGAGRQFRRHRHPVQRAERHGHRAGGDSRRPGREGGHAARRPAPESG